MIAKEIRGRSYCWGDVDAVSAECVRVPLVDVAEGPADERVPGNVVDAPPLHLPLLLERPGAARGDEEVVVFGQLPLSRSIRNSPLRTIEISPPSDNGGGKWKSEAKCKGPLLPRCRAATGVHRLLCPRPGWAGRSRWLVKSVGKRCIA